MSFDGLSIAAWQRALAENAHEKGLAARWSSLPCIKLIAVPMRTLVRINIGFSKSTGIDVVSLVHGHVSFHHSLEATVKS